MIVLEEKLTEVDGGVGPSGGVVDQYDLQLVFDELARPPDRSAAPMYRLVGSDLVAPHWEVSARVAPDSNVAEVVLLTRIAARDRDGAWFRVPGALRSTSGLPVRYGVFADFDLATRRFVRPARVVDGPGMSLAEREALRRLLDELLPGRPARTRSKRPRRKP